MEPEIAITPGCLEPSVRCPSPLPSGESWGTPRSPQLRRKADREFDVTRTMLDTLLDLYADPRERRIALAFFRLGFKRAAELMNGRD